MEIEGLAQWMWGTYGTSSWEVLHAQGEAAERVELSIEPQEVRRVLLSDGTTMEFHRVTSFVAEAVPPSEIIKKSVKVWVFPKHPVEGTHYFWRISQNLANLLSFLTCRHLAVKSVLAYTSDIREDRTLIATEDPTAVVPTRDLVDEELILSIMFADYRSIASNFSTIVSRWFEIYDRCEYALDLYFSNSVERSNAYVSTRLAVGVMAFEALYHGMVGVETKQHRMLAHVMAYGGEVFGADTDRNERASRIVRMRHDIVHGKNSYKRLGYDSKEMIDTFYNVEAVTQMLILKHLGLSIEDVNERNQGLRSKSRKPRNFGSIVDSS